MPSRLTPRSFPTVRLAVGRLHACSLLALGSLSQTTPAAHAQPDPGPAADTVTVTIVVFDEMETVPVEGVVVTLTPADVPVATQGPWVTDVEGRAVMEGLARGRYHIGLLHKDYQRLEGTFAVDRGGDFSLLLSPRVRTEEGLITGISGVVRDGITGAPVSDVVVRTEGRVAHSTKEGRFTLAGLSAGSHEVVFSHLGYQQRATRVLVHANRVTVFDVDLAVEAIELDPIEVTVARMDQDLENAGFYDRQKMGWGDYVDRRDLDERNYFEITDALWRFPGVRIQSDPSSPGTRYLVLRTMGGACYPTVYIDGVMIGNGRGPSRMNDIVDPMSVAGIEMYRRTAGIPAQYMGTNTSCGVVLIWLRRGG